MRQIIRLSGVSLIVFSAAVCTGEPDSLFRVRMAELHPVRLSSDAAPVAADETVVDDSWRIVCETDDDVVRHAAADFADYFAKSMGAEVREEGRGKREEGRGKKAIVLAVDPALEKLQSKVEVTADGVRVTGVTAREVLQGCCRIEDLLNARGRPALKRGVRTFTRMFSPRMTHSGWEVEKFPDVYMDQLAHQGMDAILVFIADPPDVSRNGKEDMNELVERARIHGLDVYAYCWFPVKAAKFNPNDPEAEAWYEETYGSIIRNAPGIKGIVCVGESVGFPAKDGNTAGFWWGRREDRVAGKALNGFYPTLEWVPWLEKVTRATRKYRPDLDVVFWTYNWYSRPAEERLPLLERIPANITMLVTFAMGDVPERKCGVDTWMWDYSITRPGPGAVFRSEAEIAKRRGIRLYSMANCGGRTWDLGCAPYHPVPARWIERFRNVRDAQERYGLCGLMESHHYGFQPNFISEIAKTAFTRETDDKALAAELGDIAARDFGRANVPTVLAAWKDWSEAFRWHSAHHCDLAGPWRTGPVYPFVLPGAKRPLPLEPKYEYYEGRRYGDGWKYLEPEYGMPADILPNYIEMSRREVAAFERGCAKLRGIIDRVPEGKRGAARRLLANGEFHLATARTMLNAREYRLNGLAYVAKETTDAARETARRKLLEILAAERENVRRTIPVVTADSALGWEPTMLHVCAPRHLDWKLRQLADEESRLAPAAAPAAERHYDFRARLNCIHERDRRDASLKPAAGEFVFADGVSVVIPAVSDEVLYTAARDFEDYLWTSMGVNAMVKRWKGGEVEKWSGGIVLSLDEKLAERQYKVSVSEKGVAIRARDSRAAAQALYHLEDLMNLRRAPFLAAGEEDRTSLFSPRMTHSGWACDEFPDPYLAHIAHAGMDAILIFVYDVDSTKGHKQYQDVNDTIRRAKRFGIDTYLYSYIHAFAHPDQGSAPFEASYGRVSAAYPDAKGFILVGESCEFPSKDPRVIPIAARDRGKEHEGDTRPMSGYFPCSDYPQWVKAVTDAIRRHNPACDVVFWTYNWGGAKDEYRRTLLENIQKDVSLMATWAMCDNCTLPNGLTFRCADYTQTPVGPGHYFESEAKWSRELGLRLYSQTCTGGITWDFGNVPYMPVPQHWKQRWDLMVAAHDDWGLVGLMEGHHQGWHPNFVTELAKEAFTRGGLPFERHIRLIAARDFGEANAEAVVAAWDKWSEASAFIAPTNENQYGPFRTGPAYPFNALGPRIQTGIGGDDTGDYPWNRHAPNGLRIARLNYADDQVRQWVEGLDYFPRLDIPADKLKVELDGLRHAEKLFMDGVAALRTAAAGLQGPRREKALRIAGLGEFMGRTCRTAVNVKAAAAEENVVLSEKATAAEKASSRARILELARDEYANAAAALPLVDADSELGWEPTMDYCGAREQIEWKLRRMRENYGEGVKGR